MSALMKQRTRSNAGHRSGPEGPPTIEPALRLAHTKTTIPRRPHAHHQKSRQPAEDRKLKDFSLGHRVKLPLTQTGCLEVAEDPGSGVTRRGFDGAIMEALKPGARED